MLRVVEVEGGDVEVGTCDCVLAVYGGGECRVVYRDKDVKKAMKELESVQEK